MYNFISFDKVGRIIQKGVVQNKDCVILSEGCSEIEWSDQSSVSFEDNYFDGQTVSIRPHFPVTVSDLKAVANDTEEIVISNIPTPAIIHIEGEAYEVVDGKITLTCDVPAKYKISADQWPYLPWSVEVEFTEAV